VKEHAFGKGKVIWEKKDPGAPRGTVRDPAAYAVQHILRLEASYPAMDAGVFRERKFEDGPGVVEQEQYGDYRVVEDVLRARGIPEDFVSDAQLRYNHRRDGVTDIYFVANPADNALEARCTFRVSGKQPELWDPMTGTTRPLHAFAGSSTTTSMNLRFEPHQSFFIVFTGPASAVEVSGPDQPRCTPVQRIAGSWDVTFGPAWAGPGAVRLDTLTDWTANAVDAVKYFSGVATYRKVFDMPGVATVGKSGMDLWIDLGIVHDMARVRLNGKDLGILWTAPWCVNTAGALREKGNVLEIDVANRWRNRLVGDERFPEDAEFGKDGNILRWPTWLTAGTARPATGRSTFASWRHFSVSTPLLPSGLLGPVQLMKQGE
jgi:hypothetical protein